MLRRGRWGVGARGKSERIEERREWQSHYSSRGGRRERADEKMKGAGEAES